MSHEVNKGEHTQKKRIASSFSAVCDIKYVPGAPEEIFHFKVFQILKFGKILKVFKVVPPE